jgi:predicted PurR-regulated permease PerM
MSAPTRLTLAVLLTVTAPLWVPLLVAFLVCAALGQIVFWFQPRS